jgi:dienelactone hydrolase
MLNRLIVLTPLVLLLTGCGLETVIFPIFDEPFLLVEPPAELGPYAFQESRIELDDLGDGEPGGLTVFAPVGAEGPRPVLIWVLGVNNRPHFQQSFHEYMASWGYIDIVPDTRDISFFDTQYHARNVANANRTFERARSGELGLPVDAERMVLGGYSVGGPMAAIAAAREPNARALVLWAPAPAFIWQGVDPAAEWPRVSQPSLFLLAEFDNVAGDWPNTLRARMTASEQTVEVVPNAVHLYFQQPPSVDDRNPATPITRQEQMRIALERTRAYLDEILVITN